MTNPACNRRTLRFPADHGTLVQIDLQCDKDSFQPAIIGLVLDEAAKGCRAVIIRHPDIFKGMKCRVKVGRLSPVPAEIKWAKELDPQVYTIGLQYQAE